jgi:RNA polymerase sigma-70 factor (ECF subfamily)
MPDDPHPNAERLLAQARQGHRESLGELLEQYRNYLALLARTQIDLRLQARVNASDVVQDAFLRACRHFGRFRGTTEAELLAWLRRVLATSLSRLVEQQLQARKRDARREVPFEGNDDSTAGAGAGLASPASSPSAQAQRKEVAAQVADQLARLPAQHREVLVLRNLEGLSFEEVACRMGKTPGATRVLWLRALDRLRRLETEGPP